MDECKIVCRKCASEIPQTTKLFQCPYCGHSGKDWFIYINSFSDVELGLHQKAHEAVEEELIRIRQVQVTPSFDDIHRIVNRVLALVDEDRRERQEQLRKLLVKNAQHDMPKNVCKGCNQTHHYVVCLYDLAMDLDNSGKLNEKLEKELSKQ